MRAITDIFSTLFAPKPVTAKEQELPGCNCHDGDAMYVVSVHESVGAEPVQKRMCMFHITDEASKGRLINFG